MIPTFKKATVLPYIAGILLLGAGFLVFLIFRYYFWSAFLAVLLYVGFDRFNLWLIKITKDRRTIAASITTLVVLVMIIVPLIVLTRQLVNEAVALAFAVKDSFTPETVLKFMQNFPPILDFITEDPFFWVGIQSLGTSMIGEYTSYFDADKISNLVNNVYNVALGSMAYIINVVGNVLLGLILLFFLFRDAPAIHRFVSESLPFPPDITHKFIRRMKTMIGAVLVGNIFVSILQGAFVALGFYICGIPNIVLYGVVAAILSLIPIIGTTPVWAPAVIYLVYIQKSPGLAIFLAIYSYGAYLILENIFKPKFLDRQLGIHPFILFLSIIGGIKEFGFTGVFLGPLFVTMFITAWSIYHIWDSERDHPLRIADANIKNDIVDVPLHERTVEEQTPLTDKKDDG